MSESGYPEGKGHGVDKWEGGVESCETQSDLRVWEGIRDISMR